MSGFSRRLEIAQNHEADVRNMLTLEGWLCEPFGQGMLSEQMRAALRDYPMGIRWMPDLIAHHRLGRWKPMLVDAKTCFRTRKTNNHSIEIRALESHERLEIAWDIPTIYVWDDLLTATPAHVRRNSWRGPEMTEYGSGTPYLLTPRSAQMTLLETLVEINEPIAA